MSLRDFLKSSISQWLPASRPAQNTYHELLKIDAADEHAYLKRQVTEQLAFLRAFDAEMRESIGRLHEPEDGKLIPAQINQLMTLRARMTTVLAMSSVQLLGAARHKTPHPVVIAKLALDLGAASGEMEQILSRIKDLNEVLREMPLDVIQNKLGSPGTEAGVIWLGDVVDVPGYGKGQLYEKFREGLIKLVLFNAYGKRNLADVYPEPRKTLDEMRRDFKNAPIGCDTW